jgi:hypothetical protein
LKLAALLLKEAIHLHGRIADLVVFARSTRATQREVAIRLHDISGHAAVQAASTEMLLGQLERMRAETLDECVALLQRCKLPEAALAIQLYKLNGVANGETT